MIMSLLGKIFNKYFYQSLNNIKLCTIRMIKCKIFYNFEKKFIYDEIKDRLNYISILMQITYMIYNYNRNRLI